jgi:hypothetical protein
MERGVVVQGVLFGYLDIKKACTEKDSTACCFYFTVAYVSPIFRALDALVGLEL